MPGHRMRFDKVIMENWDHGRSPDEPEGNSDMVDYARDQVRGVRKASPLWDHSFHALSSVPGYDLVELIHRGGQGTVYRAVQRSTRKSAAVKLFPPSPSKDQIDQKRFQREIDALSRLDDPHIVSIRDSGSVGPVRYVVMDYVSGDSLENHVRDKKLTLKAILSLFVKISRAVHFAHQRGIIHRDLKPGNILVTADGEPRILDFGLARIIHEDGHDSVPHNPVTVTGQFVGSLPWASPEQACGDSRSVDVRSDIYSLGVILYQLVTGQFPYSVVGSVRDVLQTIQDEEPIKPRSLRREIDDDVETILLTCLHKSPARRYQSAAELAGDLDRYLSGHPIQAKRDSMWYVLQRTLARHRILSVAALIVLVFLAAYVVTTTTLLGRAQTAEQTNARLADEAQMDFRLVQQTVQNLLSNWATRFGRESGAQPAQRAMLQQAYAELLPLVDRRPREPDEHVDLAVTYFLLGDICQKLENMHDAMKHLQNAAKLRRRRASKNPEDLDNLAKLSVTMVRMGDCLDGREKLASYKQSLELDEGLYARQPHNANFRSNLAWSYQRVADLHPSLFDSTSEKVEYFRKAEALFEEITKTGSAPSSEHHGLCISRLRLSTAIESSGDYDAAQGLIDKAAAACRRAVELEPNNPSYLRDLAHTLTVLSFYSEIHGDKETRWGILDEAETLYERLSKDDPASAIDLIGLANIAQYRSEVASDLADWPRVQALHERTLDLCSRINALDPELPEGISFRFTFLGHYARFLFDRGDSDAARSMTIEAIAVAEKLTERSTDPSQFAAFSRLMLEAVPPDLGDTSRAVALARQAVELSDRSLPMPFMQLATALHADCQIESALEAQQQALSMVPPDSMRAKEILELFPDTPAP